MENFLSLIQAVVGGLLVLAGSWLNNRLQRKLKQDERQELYSQEKKDKVQDLLITAVCTLIKTRGVIERAPEGEDGNATCLDAMDELRIQLSMVQVASPKVGILFYEAFNVVANSNRFRSDGMKDLSARVLYTEFDNIAYMNLLKEVRVELGVKLVGDHVDASDPAST